MADKSIREMNEREIKHNSLNAKVLRITLMGSFVLGLAALLMGFFMNTYTLVEQSIRSSYNVIRQVSYVLEMNVDVSHLTDSVLDIYHSLNSPLLQESQTDEYRDQFSHLLLDPEFTRCYDQLDYFLSNDMIGDVYLAYIDRENHALVYIFDPDLSEETGCWPGDWEKMTDTELAKYVNWDGKGILYDIGYTDRYGYMCTTGYPVYDTDDNIICYVMADVTLSSLLVRMRTFVIGFTLGLLAVIAFFGWRLSRRMKERLVKPIDEITAAAQQYMDDRIQGIASSHFSHLDIKTGDEIEKLSMTMADMEQALADYETNLTIITAETEKIATELSLAEKIQAAALPKKFPAFPDRNEFDIYAAMDPAREVGGDFYDYFLIDDDHLALTISDVSGKGIPASLFMMSSKIKIADYYMLGKSPAEVLEAANDAICQTDHEEMFVTVWTGILEISTGRVVACNAGHEYPYLRQPDGNFEIMKDKHGFVIGGMEGMKYTEYEFTMKPGTTLFVYTDGAPEATAVNNELFGMDRLTAALNKDPDASCQQILVNVREEIDEFVGEAEQFDDLTMMCVKYFGPDQKQS